MHSFCTPDLDLTVKTRQHKHDLPKIKQQLATGYQYIPQLVAAQATSRPKRPALLSGDHIVTYGELERKSNQLAWYLIALGVGPETIVGLCMERSSEAVMCALAILKAGGAYLPLDPAYPTERLAFMLGDAQPSVVVTRRELAEKLSGAKGKLLTLESDGPQIGCHSTGSPPSNVSAENLAYVIYTSGSTGQPKGVEVTHANLSNLVRWHQSTFEVSHNDRASHLASVGFDAAVWEVWPYLTAGASLHLPDELTRLAPELLRDWLVAQGITISFLPTALAERVMTLRWPATTPLRLLLTGADTLHQYPSAELPFEVVNNYGPTECTVVATSGRVPSGARVEKLPTIGRPIANTQVYILDENLKQVPSGTIGELYIGGTGIARGYLNRPDLTAQKFVLDPFSADGNARLFRTGDQASFLPDGQIAYVGRIDEQIKIRGYRIEPNEIVAVLDRHPAVTASVVVAAGGETCDEKRLIAYVVPRPDMPLTVGDLRCFLRNELPDFMIPSAYVRLDALPLTQNGKVDRAALSAPDETNMLRDEVFVAPRTSLEQRLAEILSSLLGLSRVSVNDDFFLLGGHSLLGTQLISKIRGAFGVDLALRTLFDTPTIAGLAKEIERLLLARVEAMGEDEVQRLLA